MAQLSLSARPRNFDEVIGQEKATGALRRYFEKHGDLPNALLFSGYTGTGKTSVARLCAISLSCKHNETFGIPCRDCYRAYLNATKWPSEDFNIDVTEFNCAEHRLDDLKGLLHHSTYAPGNDAPFRIYILDELQAISSPKAQNFLLKIIEDAPASTKFFLCTTDPSAILDTVVDRCITYEFVKLHDAAVGELVTWLLVRAKSELDPAALTEVLLERSIGSARAIANAVSKYITGSLPEDAVKNPGLDEVDTKRICQHVVKGDWLNLSAMLLKLELDAGQARFIRQRVCGYLKTIVLEDTSPSKRGTASKGIARLTQIMSLDDAVAVPAVVAGVHDVTRMYGPESNKLL